MGAACAAGNAGIIQGVQMLRLGDCQIALCGGVSESIHTFGIFASFNSQGALAKHEDPTKASRPFDLDRNGIVVAEGGCMFVLERLADARARGAKIYGEVVGYAMNSDATDFVLPDPQRQAECIRLALGRAGLDAEDVDIVSTHATGTTSGDAQECEALRKVWGQNGCHTAFNNTKSFIGHAMGAAGALELAGNLPAFDDGRLPRHDQPRPARSPVRAAGAGGQRAAAAGRGRRGVEQFVRDAGDQLRGNRKTDMKGAARDNKNRVQGSEPEDYPGLPGRPPPPDPCVWEKLP